MKEGGREKSQISLWYNPIEDTAGLVLIWVLVKAAFFT